MACCEKLVREHDPDRLLDCHAFRAYRHPRERELPEETAADRHDIDGPWQSLARRRIISNFSTPSRAQSWRAARRLPGAARRADATRPRATGSSACPPPTTGNALWRHRVKQLIDLLDAGRRCPARCRIITQYIQVSNGGRQRASRVDRSNCRPEVGAPRRHYWQLDEPWA